MAANHRAVTMSKAAHGLQSTDQNITMARPAALITFSMLGTEEKLSFKATKAPPLPSAKGAGRRGQA